MVLDLAGRYRYPPPDPVWLAQHVESVMEPGLPIIDAHHHLWIEGNRPYLLNELAADIADGHRIVATVFVQAQYGYRATGPAHLAPVGETEKVVAIAATAREQDMATAVAAAIVAHADLTLGDRLAEVLDAHAAAASASFRGVRHSVSRDELFPDGIVIRPAPARLLADTRYREGLKLVAARGLSYDAMLYHRQMSELTALAEALPELTIVLDHIGCILGVGPYEGREAESFREWRTSMAALARCPNVAIKIGGFGMIICGARWHEQREPPSSHALAEAWRPYFQACVELFGSTRCMFESNFPVDKAMYSYRTLWNAFKRLAAEASAEEKSALFSGTAARIYRIAPPGPIAPHG